MRDLGPAQWGSGLAWRPDGSEVAYAWLDGAELRARRDADGRARLASAHPRRLRRSGHRRVARRLDHRLHGRDPHAVRGACCGWDAEEAGGRGGLRPGFLPDGTRVAFAVYRGVAGSGSQLATVRTDGSDERMLTSNGAADRYPTWSPDGTQLLEARTLAGSAAVVAVAADGSGERIVRQEAQGTYSLVPFWGAGGSSILLSPGALHRPRALPIWPDGGGLRQLTQNHADHGSGRPADRPVDRVRPGAVRRPAPAHVRPVPHALGRQVAAPADEHTEVLGDGSDMVPDGRRLALCAQAPRDGSSCRPDLARRTQRTITPRESPWRSRAGRAMVAGSPSRSTTRASRRCRRPDGRSRRTIVPATVDSHGSARRRHPRGRPARPPRVPRRPESFR